MSRPSRRAVADAVATVGGLGRIPRAPGTAGSVAGAALAWLLPSDIAVQVAVLAFVTGLGVWASGGMAGRMRRHDPGCIVIDEVAGMLVAGFLLPKQGIVLLAAFLLFRLFDIGKWPPMRQLERLRGGWGIMADDLAAGAISRLILLFWPVGI